MAKCEECGLEKHQNPQILIKISRGFLGFYLSLICLHISLFFIFLVFLTKVVEDTDGLIACRVNRLRWCYSANQNAALQKAFWLKNKRRERNKRKVLKRIKQAPTCSSFAVRNQNTSCVQRRTLKQNKTDMSPRFHVTADGFYSLTWCLCFSSGLIGFNCCKLLMQFKIWTNHRNIWWRAKQLFAFSIFGKITNK